MLGHSTPADAWGIAGSTHGGYDIIHSDGTAWFPVSGSHVACGPVPGYLQYGLGGPDDDASFGCAGDDRIAHWDGVGWVLVPAAGSTPSPPPAVPGEVIATWNAAPGTTFALGYLVSPVTAADPNGADFHLDDRIWRGQRADVLDGIGSGRFLATLYREDLSGAIWGPRGDDGWASLAGTYHWNGMAWTAVSCGPTHSPCIWGSASDDVWASMYYRNYPHEIWRWDGATWSVVATSDYLACGVGAWAHDTHGGLWRRDTRSP